MASLIPQDILNAILDHLDIVSVISESVPLKKSGKDYKGLCPFHEEKTPSFMVSPEKRIFHCFGCGEGGNLFTFVSKSEKLSFPEVVQKLAERAGVDLTKYDRNSNQSGEKEILYKINRYAAWFYAESLKQSQGQIARSYLVKRGISDEMIEKFRLGVAPDDWESLTHFLKGKKIPLELAEKLGLIRRRRDGSCYDFFRNRLIFPIIDFEGRIIGFGGRRLKESSDNQEAKYINSPESPIYHKGNSIYGLFQTKKSILKKEEVILVEGYLDLIRLFQAGIENVAAPLGTALTLMQIKALNRLAKHFVLIFDGDEAGQRALMKALTLLFEIGVHPRILKLPKDQDPDSYVAKVGGQVFGKEIADSRAAMEWLIIDTLSHAGTQTSERVEAVKKLIPLVQKLPSEIEQQSYMVRLSHFLGVGDEALSDIHKNTNLKERTGSYQQKKSKISLERIFLQLYVRYPPLVHPFLNEKVLNDLENESLKRLGVALYQQYKDQGMHSIDKLVGLEGGLDVNGITELVFDHEVHYKENEVEQLILDCLRRLKEQKLQRELKILTGEIHLAEIKKDPELLKELLNKKNDAVKDLKELQAPH